MGMRCFYLMLKLFSCRLGQQDKRQINDAKGHQPAPKVRNARAPRRERSVIGAKAALNLPWLSS